MGPVPGVVELRSDTFTLPTDAMRRAMAEAEVGDDVWGEDPTVRRLEARAAEMVGKDAALFVPSGTMGNLCSLLSHSRPGQEVLLELDSHIYHSEVGGGSVVGGLQMRPLETADGRLRPEQIQVALRGRDIHEPPTGLLCIENTHNRKGGTCLGPAQTRELAEVAHQAGIPVHLDGARIFNAAVALGVDARTLTQPVDSVMFCLSKGLSAPVGSLVAGSAPFIDRARRARKMLGGGMRQAGVLAAAGLCALDLVDRLSEDHANARRLAAGLAELPLLDVDPARVETNMVFLRCRPPMTGERFVQLCAEGGVKVARSAPDTIRMVTHRGVSGADVDRAVATIREALLREARVAAPASAAPARSVDRRSAR